MRTKDKQNEKEAIKRRRKKLQNLRFFTYLDEEEVNSKSWKTAGQLDIADLGVDLGGAHQLAMLLEDFLLDFVVAHVVLGQELLEATRGEMLSLFLAVCILRDD